MYGLQTLQDKVVSAISADLDVTAALQCLVDVELLGFDEFEQQCEQHIAVHYEESVTSSAFFHVSSSQLGRIIARSDLTVCREEIVLESLLSLLTSAAEAQVLQRNAKQGCPR